MAKATQIATMPDLTGAAEALTKLATRDAIEHLEAALRSLQGLAESLGNGDALATEEKRQLERELLRFRAELRDAGVLAERGLAYCQDWVQQLNPPPAYQANGTFANTGSDRHELSFDA